jgi:pyruvate/2-oxoglutarate dehydrogenase complex dihydrolipoamide acyltransferase (E2) component
MANEQSTVIVKDRLFTWFEEVESPAAPGQMVLGERLANMGEEVEVARMRDIDFQKGVRLGSFYSDEEADAIRLGTYRGSDYMVLSAARRGLRPVNPIQPVEGEGALNVAEASTDELADYIKSNSLTPSAVIALAGDDPDTIEKVLDAETLATGNDPREEVVNALEEKLANASPDGGQESYNATPAAVELAADNGIDVRRLEGTGTDGRVTVDDVRKAIAEQ